MGRATDRLAYQEAILLLGKPTKYGAGITLVGDFNDLADLHETIHYFASENGPIAVQHDEFVLGLAYDIRHAYQGDRQIETIKYPKASSTYFAFDTLWPIFLVQLGLLRTAASYLPTQRTHQANLYRLEACTEHALSSLDADAAKQCIRWLSDFSSLPNNYLIDFVSYQSLLYVSSAKTAKGRIRRLPELLRDISPYSPAYQSYEKELVAIAEKEKCRPQDLHDFAEWPEFKW